MSEEIETPLYPYELEIEGLGVLTVLESEGEPGYRVRLPDGQVTAYYANSEDPSEENAAADIAYAIANPAPAPVPSQISRAQFVIAARRVLDLKEGYIFAIISSMPAGETQETARDLWENAQTFRRENTFLNSLAVLNGNTQADLDNVFRTGAALNLD